jgi:hypothetical protein
MKSLFMLAASLFSSAPVFSQSESIADHIRALDSAQREATLRGDSTLEEQYTAIEFSTGQIWVGDLPLAEILDAVQ